MYSLSIITSFLSVWCLFAASAKVEFTKKHLTLRLAKHPTLSIGLSAGLFLGGTILLCTRLGVVTGILAEVFVWIMLASGVLLFAPFPKLKGFHVLLMGLLIIGIELLFTFIF